MSDKVNNPSHYTQHPSGVECIVVVEHMNFNLGNAMKYIWRAGLKSENPVEDLQKAEWYIKRELKRISKQSDQSGSSAKGYPYLRPEESTQEAIARMFGTGTGD